MVVVQADAQAWPGFRRLTLDLNTTDR